MNRRLQQPLRLLAPLLILIAGVVLFLSDPWVLQISRNAVFDHYQRLHPRPYQSVPVRIVDIDEESLARLGQWPWPRIQLARMVDRLRAAGAAAVVFDIILAEPDRTSPRFMADQWPLSEQQRVMLRALPDHDEILARSIAQGGVVLGFAVDRNETDAGMPLRPYRVVTKGADDLFSHSFNGAVRPLEPFEQAADGLGALTFVPDQDGVVRQVPLLVRLKDSLMATLMTEALRVGQGENTLGVKLSAAGGGIERVRIGAFTIPTTPKGELWLHYSQARPERYISAWQVLDESVSLPSLEGQLLLLGTSASGLLDLRFSALGLAIPGVEVHAQALEQVLSGHYLQRPVWGEAVEVVEIVMGGLLVGLAGLYAGALVSAAVLVVLVGLLLWAGWWAFLQQGLLLDPVSPGVVLLAVFLFSSLIHHYGIERRQRWVRSAFSRYVSPNLVNYLVSHPDDLHLGGSRRSCSFIFTDLAGFTTLMERVDPAEAVALLNDYLDRMIAIAFEHQGTLDRIVGDAVAILFSAPIEQPDHQVRALRCALAMDRFARQYTKEINEQGIPLGKTRIGVHSGEVIVGNFGGKTIFDYRALGDPINTASRLEGVNKYLGTHLCVSEATVAGCPGGHLRRSARLVLKGKSEPLLAYEPIEQERDEAYEAAYQMMFDGDERAVSQFEDLAAERPDDPLVRLHLERLQRGEQGDLMVMTSK